MHSLCTERQPMSAKADSAGLGRSVTVTVLRDGAPSSHDCSEGHVLVAIAKPRALSVGSGPVQLPRGAS